MLRRVSVAGLLCCDPATSILIFLLQKRREVSTCVVGSANCSATFPFVRETGVTNNGMNQRTHDDCQGTRVMNVIGAVLGNFQEIDTVSILRNHTESRL